MFVVVYQLMNVMYWSKIADFRMCGFILPVSHQLCSNQKTVFMADFVFCKYWLNCI